MNDSTHPCIQGQELCKQGAGLFPFVSPRRKKLSQKLVHGLVLWLVLSVDIQALFPVGDRD